MELELAIARTTKEATDITGIMFAATLVVTNGVATRSCVLPSLFEFARYFSQFFEEPKWIEIEKALFTNGGWKGTLQGEEHHLNGFFSHFH